jgi:RHS repeat-associated protein
VAKESSFYNDASGPTDVLASFADSAVAQQSRYTYDSLERPDTDALWSQGVKKWQTSATYDGDRINVTPPAGETPTTVIFDALDRPTALRQYRVATPTGGYDETRYGYDPADQLTSMIDPAGNQWTYTYDLLGRLTAETDPDTGTSRYTYDAGDRLTSSTDSRGEKLAYRYDKLDRLVELRDDTTAGNLRAAWTYDTLAKGLPTSATRYHGGQEYIQAVTGYSNLYDPSGFTTTIPAAQGTLAGVYQTDLTYRADGSVATVAYPAAGGLPAETVTLGYRDTGHLATAAGAATYLAAAEYYWHGAVKERLLGAAGKRVRITTGVDEATGRLTKNQVHTENPASPNTFDEKLTEAYTYDPAGNITAIAEVNETAGTTISRQCFLHDYLRRLTEAWTTTTTACQATPNQAAVGGPDPYWHSYTYDAVGNRVTDTVHTAGGDTVRDYTTPAAGQTQPHTLTRRQTRGGPTSTSPDTAYTYDLAGNLTGRTTTATTGTTTDTLTWDAEGHLERLQRSNGATHSYVYDADGNRLIAADPDATTAYLGHTELRRNAATGQVTAARYYGDAVRTTTGGLTWMITDHHGTGQLAIDAATLTTNRRRTTPFGEARGPAPAWPDRHGFVDGTADPTGFVHLGAREYDPSTGRFISVDPLVDHGDPQTLHGYAYGNNSPVTFTDPDGLFRCGTCGGGGGSASGGGGRGACTCGGGGSVRGGSNRAKRSLSKHSGPHRGTTSKQERREIEQIKRDSRAKAKRGTPKVKRKPTGTKRGHSGKTPAKGKGKHNGKGKGNGKGTKGKAKPKSKGKAKGKGKGSRGKARGKGGPGGPHKPGGKKAGDKPDTPDLNAPGKAREKLIDRMLGNGVEDMGTDAVAYGASILRAARGNAGTGVPSLSPQPAITAPPPAADSLDAGVLRLLIAMAWIIARVARRI